MTIQSQMIYWLECDAWGAQPPNTDCWSRCPTGDLTPPPRAQVTLAYEPDGYDSEERAVREAVKRGWRIDKAGRWFCDIHVACAVCGDPIDDSEWARDTNAPSPDNDKDVHRACLRPKPVRKRRWWRR